MYLNEFNFQLKKIERRWHAFSIYLFEFDGSWTNVSQLFVCVLSRGGYLT